MTHWRKDTGASPYVAHWDLPSDRDLIVTIAKSSDTVEMRTRDGKAVKRRVLLFEGAKKGMVLNPTNGKVIERLYGSNFEGWVGKRIALYVAQTEVAGEKTGCIRVRPVPPAKPAADREPGSEG